MTSAQAPSPSCEKKLLVLGIGQDFRGDDAAGLEVVRRWLDAHPVLPEGVEAELCDHPGLHLIEKIQGYKAVLIVDAINAHGHPGMIRLLTFEDLNGFSTAFCAVHGWGIAETLQLAMQVDPTMAGCAIRIIGIIGEKFDLGSELSQPIKDAIPEAVALLESEVQAICQEL